MFPFQNHQSIKWKKFLEDERYSGTVGIYEGGETYAYGVWRPTDDSMMRSAVWETTFNAPSREAIYNRIHKLAFGNNWQYDYETFVEYDQKNIAAEKTAQVSQSTKSVPYPARINKNHIFKIVESSVTKDGKKKVTVIMN